MNQIVYVVNVTLGGQNKKENNMHLKMGVDNLELTSKYDLIDLDTGERITNVQEANDETGEFSLFLYNIEEKDLVYNKNKKEYVSFKFKGNIKLRKKE